MPTFKFVLNLLQNHSYSVASFSDSSEGPASVVAATCFSSATSVFATSSAGASPSSTIYGAITLLFFSQRNFVDHIQIDMVKVTNANLNIYHHQHPLPWAPHLPW